MDSSKKLKVGIIVDDIDQSYLIYDLYKKSLESDYYDVEYLIIQKSNNLKIKNSFNKLLDYVKKKGIRRFIDRLFFEFIDLIESRLIKKNDKFKKVFLKHPISKFDINIQTYLKDQNKEYEKKDVILKTPHPVPYDSILE